MTDGVTEPLPADRPACYVDGEGIINVRASSLGDCPKALAAQAFGYERDPFPPQVVRAMKQGTELEEEIIASLPQLLFNRVETQVPLSMGWPLEWPQICVTGTVDVVVAEKLAVDIKTYSHKLKVDREYLERHYGPQIWFYGFALAESGGVDEVAICAQPVNRETGELEGQGEMHYWSLDSLAHHQDRIHTIERYVNLVFEHQTLEVLADHPCTTPAFQCSTFRLHDILQEGIATNLNPPDVIKEALDTLDLVRKLRQEYGVSEKDEKEARQQVKDWIATQGEKVKGVLPGGWEVAYSPVAQHERLDITLEEGKEMGIPVKLAGPKSRMSLKKISSWGSSDDEQ